MPFPSARTAAELVEKIRALLATRGLSLADVERRSSSGPPFGPQHHVPHNLYAAVRRRRFTPSLFQIEALSLISDYRFVDWLQLFGFSLDDVPRFHILFPALRTVELDARIYHYPSRIPVFRDLVPGAPGAPFSPLSKWLSSTGFQREEASTPAENSSFRFVKIGSRDAFAFPDLLPGSIVRVNVAAKHSATNSGGKAAGRRLILVEHGSGLLCSRICHPEPGRVLLSSKHLPYASMELELGTQIRLLGKADLELRRSGKSDRPVVPKSFGEYWQPTAFQSPLPPGNVGEFIRRARTRSGLSFREASKRTRVIARSLRDSRYFCAPGSLSDFETWTTPPRHIHKLIAICAVYFASAADWLVAAGVQLTSLGKRSMPRSILNDQDETRLAADTVPQSKFILAIERLFREIPYFLFAALPSFFGLPNISVRDIFWSEDRERFLHPYLKGAIFFAVDRKRKVPHSSLDCPKWAQPIYVLLRRDGSYLCGTCVRNKGMLSVQPCTAGLPRIMKFRDRVDAEIVGEVIGIVRRLP